MDGVAAMLPYVSVSDELLEKIRMKAEIVDQGSDSDVRAFALYPFLVQKRPGLKSELLDRLRRALVSDQEDEVRLATMGLYRWINSLDDFARIERRSR